MPETHRSGIGETNTNSPFRSTPCSLWGPRIGTSCPRTPRLSWLNTPCWAAAGALAAIMIRGKNRTSPIALPLARMERDAPRILLAKVPLPSTTELNQGQPSGRNSKLTCRASELLNPAVGETKSSWGTAAGGRPSWEGYGRMGRLFRRFVATSVCVLMLGALALSPPAWAAGKTVTIWWNQGFYPAEDQAMKDTVAEWEK